MNVLSLMTNVSFMLVKVIFLSMIICDNAKIDGPHNFLDTIELNGRMTHNFCRPWSKAPGLRSEFPKPVVRPLKEL